MFKAINAVLASTQKQSSCDAVEKKQRGDLSAESVFKAMHGMYGNLFLSRFATGDIVDGKDNGVMSAKSVWSYSLRGYCRQTVRDAILQTIDIYQDYPPTLPQFITLCKANKPVALFKPSNTLQMSKELRSQYAAKAREINAKHYARQADMARIINADINLTGLDALKQAIASAAADAGNDEAKTLIRLDKMLKPKAYI